MTVDQQYAIIENLPLLFTLHKAERLPDFKLVITEISTQLVIAQLEQMGILERNGESYRVATQIMGNCPTCGKNFDVLEEFDNVLGIQEFIISNMCAECQDKAFSEDDEDD